MKFENLVKDIVSQLNLKRQTLSVAESCTGGLLSGHISSLAGVSSVYVGGVVAYSNSVKVSLLGILQSTLEKYGAVSRETALELASGARLRLDSDWSVSITGIAGPTGGTPDKPVGTVWIAVAGPNFEDVLLNHFSGDRSQIQNAAVETALKMLKSALSKI